MQDLRRAWGIWGCLIITRFKGLVGEGLLKFRMVESSRILGRLRYRICVLGFGLGLHRLRVQGWRGLCGLGLLSTAS